MRIRSAQLTQNHSQIGYRCRIYGPVGCRRLTWYIYIYIYIYIYTSIVTEQVSAPCDRSGSRMSRVVQYRTDQQRTGRRPGLDLGPGDQPQPTSRTYVSLSLSLSLSPSPPPPHSLSLSTLPLSLSPSLSSPPSLSLSRQKAVGRWSARE